MLISAIMIAVLFAIVSLHVLGAILIGRWLSGGSAVLALVALTLIAYGAMYITLIPIGLYVGFSTPYTWGFENQVGLMTFGLFFAICDVIPGLKDAVGYDQSQSINLVFGLSLLFLLALPLMILAGRKSRIS